MTLQNISQATDRKTYSEQSQRSADTSGNAVRGPNFTRGPPKSDRARSAARAGPASRARGFGSAWILGRNNLYRDLFLVRPLDREPDLILFGALYNAAYMKPRNITNAEAFADNTTKIAHP
jgi:hypothetical protein